MAGSENYTIKLVNTTETDLNFAVYQRNVAWETREVVNKEEGGPTPNAEIDFTLTYGVALARWNSGDEKYTLVEIEHAALGKTYQVNKSEGQLAIVSNPDLKVPSSRIALKNNSGETLNMGFALNGLLVAAQNVNIGETIEYFAQHIYYVATYSRSIDEGELIFPNAVLGPVTVDYSDGHAVAEVEAVKIEGKPILKVSTYPRVSV